MKKLERETYKCKSQEILSWYEDQNLTSSAKYVFVKDVLQKCFLDQKRTFTINMQSFFDKIYEEGKPEAVKVDNAILEKIKNALDSGFCNDYSKEKLLSFKNKIELGSELSEKQNLFLNDLLKSVSEIQQSGFWVPSEQEIEDMFSLAKLARKYSAFYLTNYNHLLEKNIKILGNAIINLTFDRKLTNEHKKGYEFVLEKMSKRLNEYKNPSFEIGQIVFLDKINIVTVLKKPVISEPFGYIEYQIMMGTNIFSVNENRLSKKGKDEENKIIKL